LAGGKGDGGRSVLRRRNLVERRVEGRSEASEVGAEEGRGGRLESLDRVVTGRSGRNGSRLVAEEVLVELDAARSVVDRNIDVATTASLSDVTLDALAGVVLLGRVGGEGSELDDALDLERGVNLSELLEETGENDVLEGSDVTGGLGLVLERLEDRLNLRGDRERVEVDLEDVVELAKLGRDALEDVTVESVGDEARTGGSGTETDEGGETTETTLGLSLLRVDDVALDRLDAGTERDGEGGDEDEGGELLELSVGTVSGAGKGDTGGVKGVKLAVRGGVEEEVVADGEDLGHLVVEGSHHARLRGALRHADEGVNVLGGAETLLPQLELDGRVELLEASVEVALERVGVVEVDRVGLVGVLLGGGEVGTEGLAEAAELGLALVLEAELERLVADGL
jgi:hypothetical protein